MSSDAAFLDAAATIGRRICDDAVWHDGQCAWMGAATDPSTPGRPEQRALGPDLYKGTAGVGLYLAQLAPVTGGAYVRRTAVGAMRHAIARAARLPIDRRDGFHAGLLGIAWAATRAGSLLGAEELRELARATVADTSAPASAGRCPDLLTGAAGRIGGLLALSDALDEPGFVDDAVADGEQLLATASVDTHGWSWKDPTRRSPYPLCGLSRGAAGIGAALLELFAVTGDRRFGEAAAGAFDYERSWLDPSSGTWPDLHVAEQRRGEPRWFSSSRAGTWSHGEAGILVSRLRAIAILGDGPHLGDADVAAQTTQRLLAEALRHEIGDLSPCSGLAGLADALLCAALQSADRWGDTEPVAIAAGNVALERYDPSSVAWPCGVPYGTSPSLFLGLSGIGWLFLRLHDSAIDSSAQLHIPLTRAFSGA
jgi:lantibiotic modifying enzyme